MRGIRVTVDRITGECTALPEPMRIGDEFLVCKGKVYTPGATSICISALQSLMPFIVAKHETLEAGGTTWAGKLTTVRCPDPCGHVHFKLEPAELSREDLGGAPCG